MSRVIHFEIHAAEPERAIEFYTRVFGWEFTKWSGPWEYWMIKTGEDGAEGINGGMVQRLGEMNGEAVIAYVCTIQVDHIEDSEKRIKEAGGMIVLPSMEVPGVGQLMYAKDTEGNMFAVLQPSD